MNIQALLDLLVSEKNSCCKGNLVVGTFEEKCILLRLSHPLEIKMENMSNKLGLSCAKLSAASALA